MHSAVADEDCRQVDVITEEMEKILWDQGLLGDKDPRTLLQTLVYLFGLNFKLRSRDHFRNLQYHQFVLYMANNGRKYLLYTEVTLLL